jgi:hypothetical protein
MLYASPPYLHQNIRCRSAVKSTEALGACTCTSPHLSTAHKIYTEASCTECDARWLAACWLLASLLVSGFVYLVDLDLATNQVRPAARRNANTNTPLGPRVFVFVWVLGRGYYQLPVGSISCAMNHESLELTAAPLHNTRPPQRPNAVVKSAIPAFLPPDHCFSSREHRY